MDFKRLFLGTLLCIVGFDLCAGHRRSKVAVDVAKRQALLCRLGNVKNSLFRIKKHPMHGPLKGQVLRLNRDFRQKDQRGELTVEHMQKMHAKSAIIECKINCAAFGKTPKLHH